MAPLQVDLVHNLKRFGRTVKQLDLDAKRALRTTTSRVTFLSHARLMDELKEELENPVPWIVSGYRYIGAKDLDNPVGKIVARDARRGEYLDSITRTGELIPNQITLRGRRRGHLKSNEYYAPTRDGLKRDSRGNVGAAFRRADARGIRFPGPKPPRGIYFRVGPRKRKLRKILAPAVYTRYRPPVDPVSVIDWVSARHFRRIYRELVAQNQRKTGLRLLKQGR